jgi:hypothetical protein
MRERLPLESVHFVVFGILVLGSASAGLAAESRWVPGIQELYRLDRLAVLRESIRTASVSSYDRTGGNNDGFGGQYSFVRKEKDRLVLAEGPNNLLFKIVGRNPKSQGQGLDVTNIICDKVE